MRPYRFMGKLTVDVPPRCQVTEGSAIKLQHPSLSANIEQVQNEKKSFTFR
jgi:hypothetical protein